MTNRTKFAVAGAIIGVILLLVLPGWAWLIGAVVILAALSIPAVGYLMLDPSQRRRLRNMNRRGLSR